jgi:hypothetical protein
MNSFASALAPTSTLDDDGWDDLLSFIEERRVIPIVGPELLLVNTEQGPRLLYSWLADKTAGATDVAFVDCAAAERRAELALAVGDTETVRSLVSSNIVRIQALQGLQGLQGLQPEYELHRNQLLFYVGDRDLATHNKDDHWQHVELAAALYASALTDPSKSAALLAEAGRLMASTPAEMHGLRIFTLWRDRIAAGTAGLRDAPAKTAG